MDDVKDVLRQLDSATPPDVWAEVTSRDEQAGGAWRASVAQTRRSRRPELLVAALAIALVGGAIAISGGSTEATHEIRIASIAMEPTLRAGSCATINTEAYDASIPQRGEMIAFRSADAPGHLLIDRVIGLPGERVVQRDGVVSIDGEVLAEPYAVRDARGRFDGAWIVEGGHLFVMGDNRPVANDSRSFLGQIPISAIYGSVSVDPTLAGCPDAPPAPVKEQ